MKKITNPHFKNFKEAVNICFNREPDDVVFLSDMTSASFDGQKDHICFYSSEIISDCINMETIKLDDVIKRRKEMLSWVYELPAVDAVCIDANNEWYLIEFKNAPIDNKISSIKNKMLSSIWFCFYILSKSEKDDNILFKDALKFAREHMTYIIVGRRRDNITEAEYIREAESRYEHYQPHKLRQFINYYFKDVYMLTEYELRKFILEFKA